MTTTPTGVQVADGSPDALQGAADYHYQLADGLEYHAGSMDTAATALNGVWQGEASSRYQALSTLVAGHFRTTARTARDAGNALKRYSAELRRLQEEGQRALRQAVYWLDQVHQWGTRYRIAERDVHTAETEVRTAQAALNSALAAGPKGAAQAGTDQTRLHTAQNALQTAQNQLKIAGEELRNAERELLGWQRRGRQAWEDAQHEADRATGTLDATCIAPPPLAAPPAPSTPKTPGLGDAVTVAQDLAGAGLAFTTSAAMQWAKETGSNFKTLRDYWVGERNRLATAADGLDDPQAAEQAIRDWAGTAGEASQLGRNIEGLTQLEHAANWMGPVGGVLDAGVHLLQGESLPKAVEQGAGSALGGTVGTWGGAITCGAIPGAEELAPICAGAGGALGGLAGDLVGGLFD